MHNFANRTVYSFQTKECFGRFYWKLKMCDKGSWSEWLDWYYPAISDHPDHITYKRSRFCVTKSNCYLWEEQSRTCDLDYGFRLC